MNSRLSAAHVPALDGLRGIAIALVLMHMLHAPQPEGVVSGIFIGALQVGMSAGWIGVQLFFVLSGYLITGGLIDTRSSTNYFSRFYVRRALRIFPLYYGVLVIVFVIRPYLTYEPDAWNLSWERQFWLWSYLYNWVHPFGYAVKGFAHFWSLAVEEQFYLIWPLVVYKLSTRKILIASLAVMIAALAIRVGLRINGVSAGAVYVFTICRMDALVAGAAIAALIRMPGWHALGSARRRGVIATGVACLIGAMLLLPTFDQNSLLMQTAGMTLLAVGFGAVVLVLSDPERQSVGVSLLSWKPLVQLGKYSYGMYVFFLPLDQFVLQRFIPKLPGAEYGLLPLTYLLFGTGVTFAIAAASYHLYEKRFLKLKELWSARDAAVREEDRARLPGTRAS